MLLRRRKRQRRQAEAATVAAVAKAVRDYVYYFGVTPEDDGPGWKLDGKPGKLEEWIAEALERVG